MLKLKNILTIVIISILIITMGTVVNASENDDDEYTNIIDEGDNVTTNNSVDNTNNTLNNANSNNSNTSNRANNSITNANTLPKAGATENISAIVVAIIFGISAVYAYKKIRDYNIK